ncbi:hypothetical protein ACFWQC_25220 [Nocardioides sp. NPDC058538]|uniref:hypothetical protein n=1 Tax=Nocardioides sp. NPDC058538 TaxID=3346542 RepID=UPI003668BE80
MTGAGSWPDVAVMIADGGEAIADIDVLHHQYRDLGAVVSPATPARALDKVSPVKLKKNQTARPGFIAMSEAHPSGGLPASKAAGEELAGDAVAPDVDATVVVAQEGAARPKAQDWTISYRASSPSTRPG